MDVGASLVVGTAGHIDHGKTSLVRTLTGVDLDTLPEEKERGITISLGFAPMDLPDGRRVAFVDVPGHEKLVRTMVAGATGIDAVLLCVSAVEGVMPQTKEHLAILGILGVQDGAVVVTMADLVDAELLELAVDDAATVVKGTFLDGKPVIPYSSVTGQGKAELVALLGTFARRTRPTTGPFRLPVDRAFVRPGFGTVVTGTAWSGRLEDGAAVTVLPSGKSTRVRGIQAHGKPADHAEAGWRTALNLAGIEKDDVPRGTVVVSGGVPSTSMIDVRYRHLPDSPEIEDGLPIRLLHGTAERIGKLYIAEDDLESVAPGSTVWAQIRLDEPLPCLPGDRFVVRRPSPQETLGGGEIVDPWAPKLRRKDRDLWAKQLERLSQGERIVWLERAGEEGLEPAAWAERAPGVPGVALGDRVFAPTIVARLEGALLEALEAFHRESPLTRGANRRELRRGRLGHLSERTFDALIERLASGRTVEVEGPLLRLAGFSVALSAGDRALRERIVATLTAAGLEGVAPKELHEKHPEPQVASIAHLLEAEGVAAQVPSLGWVSKAALDGLEARVRAFFAEKSELTPGDFKELTGLSRKAAIPLLEWLDKSKLTKRLGDARVKGPAL
jgi:selenocysteine-specific elongation factor